MLTTERRNAECICTVLCVKFIVLHVFCSLEGSYLTLLKNGKWVKLRVKIPLSFMGNVYGNFHVVERDYILLSLCKPSRCFYYEINTYSI